MAASDASDAAPSDAAAARVGEMIARLLEEALPLGPSSTSSIVVVEDSRSRKTVIVARQS